MAQTTGVNVHWRGFAKRNRGATERGKHRADKLLVEHVFPPAIRMARA
jgi:hypothetical protein